MRTALRTVETIVPEITPEVATVWEALRTEAIAASDNDGSVTRSMCSAVLAHSTFGQALAYRLAVKLANHDIEFGELFTLIDDVIIGDPGIPSAAARDLSAVRERDPSNSEILTPFLYFKGFLALQGYRVSHRLWKERRLHLARHLQSRMSEIFGVDIHPAARLGSGIMLDHGSGLVIGETAVVEDDVSILQNVTLGGTGKEAGDRHPKIRRGVLIGAVQRFSAMSRSVRAQRSARAAWSFRPSSPSPRSLACPRGRLAASIRRCRDCRWSNSLANRIM